MADENQDLEEWQRQQAAAAVAASQNQPNTIPAGSPDVSRAMDYTVRGLPEPPTPDQQQNLGIGNYIDQSGQSLGATHEATGAPLPAPQGAVGIQGQLSPQEEAFWAANPAGAIAHPQTGELIGLGTRPQQPSGPIYTGVGSVPPRATPEGGTLVTHPQTQTQHTPDFIQLPEIDPAIGARRQEIANEIEATRNSINTASTQRGRGQPSQYDVLNSRLSTLMRADSALALEQHRQSSERANAALKNSELQEKFNINRDATAASIALGGIAAQPGTDEYKKAVANIALSYPHATKDPRFEAALIKASTFHDERAASRARAEAAGLVPVVTGYGAKGESVKYVRPGAEELTGVPAQAQERYAKLQAGIEGHLEESAKEAKANAKKKLVNEPYSKASVLHAQQLEASMLEKQHPGLATSRISPDATEIQGQQPKGYYIGVQYGNLIYQGGDPNARSSWKTVGEQIAQ